MSVRALIAVAAVSIAASTVTRDEPDSGAARMVEAARAFLADLDAAQRAEATFAFADDERSRWHFVPPQARQYPGLALRDMTTAQRRRAHALLQSALSSSGYLKIATIIQLETELRRAAERAGRDAPHRDPEQYAFAVFGTPSVQQPWGWRIQGHHLSLNFTAADGRVVATTPAFYGANPHEIRDGPHAGIRALGFEEDRARELLASLNQDQLGAAIIEDRAPRDVILGPGTPLDRLGEPLGLSWTSLDGPQRELLWSLIEEFAHDLRAGLARVQLDRVRAAGRDHIRFAWAGSTERGEPHYYRVHGPTFAIEYDNTQNQANHSHSVWHDLENDFGRDLLREHLEELPHGRGSKKRSGR